jgi:hypothetical protein
MPSVPAGACTLMAKIGLGLLSHSPLFLLERWPNERECRPDFLRGCDQSPISSTGDQVDEPKIYIK